MPELDCDITPDGTYVFELARADGERAVVTVFPEDVDEIAGPASEAPSADEKQRRFRVARLLAESELASPAPDEAGEDAESTEDSATA